MANQDLSINERLRVLKQYSKDLSKAASWKGSGDTIRAVQNYSTNTNGKEYIYEFYCYIRLLVDIKHSYNLEFKPGTKGQVLFPKAPGQKKNFPYFSITDRLTGKEVYQFCAGIKIKGRAGETSAPDISLLTGGASDNPTYDDVEMILDAKFRENDDARITKNEFGGVYAMIINLGCQNGPKTPITFHHFIFPIDLNGNCILTNGQVLNDNVVHHQMYSIKCVERFDDGKTPRMVG